MSKIVAKEHVGGSKFVILSSLGHVFLDDLDEDYIDGDGKLLATSSAGCRGLAGALNRIADEIDEMKRLLDEKRG